MSDVSVFESLLRAMRDRGDCAALEDQTEAFTYATVASMVAARRISIREAGLRDGDRVSVVIRQRASDVVNLLAVMASGGVAVPCDSMWPAHRKSETERDAGIRFRLDGEIQDELEGMHEPNGLGVDSLALLIYTSGSTAEPRGVMIRAEHIAFCTERIGERLKYAERDRVTCPVRLSFDYGLYQVFLAFAAGATLVLWNVTDPFGWLRTAVLDSHPTVLVLTPSMARAALTKGHQPYGSREVRLITFTGESVDATVLDAVTTAFRRASIVLMYGVTECKRVSISEPDEWRSAPTAAGTPLRGTTVVIRDPHGRPLGTREVGQIFVRGPSLSVGYWGDPELTERRFPARAGVRELATEDLGFVDSSGRLHVVGRFGDTYKERGQRVSAQEVEAAAASCDGVDGAVCVPPHSGVHLSTLFVAARAHVSQQGLIELLKDRLGVERVPRRIVRLKALPLTPNGKADRNALRSLATESEVRAW